jgi:LysM repeat protein
MRAMIVTGHACIARSAALSLPAVLLLAAVLVLLPKTVSAQDAHEAVSQSIEAQQVLGALNAQRSAAGLGLLVSDPLLDQAAQVHANDILNNYNYSHRGSDGSSVQARVARTGYAASPWVSENWVSSTSLERAMNWWMNDYVHRVNILTSRWVEVGVGVAVRPETGEMIFVTVFSAGRNVSEATVSAASVEAVKPPVVKPPVVETSGPEYVVKRGDTLLTIGLAYGIDWSEIASANALSEHSLLQIGQVLRIPGQGDYAEVADAAAVAPGIGGPSSQPGVPHVIQAGETLVSIAAKNGTTWRELARFNGLAEDTLLQIGQTIQIPQRVSTETQVETVTESDQENGVHHVVEVGDTLFGISLAHTVDLQELMALNGLSEESLLQPGQTLRLR